MRYLLSFSHVSSGVIEEPKLIITLLATRRLLRTCLGQKTMENQGEERFSESIFWPCQRINYFTNILGIKGLASHLSSHVWLLLSSQLILWDDCSKVRNISMARESRERDTV